MNKKALYEAIMKDISKIVKKKINENIEENTINIPSQYYDEDGDIDLSDLSVLPQNIINALAKDLLTNGDFQEDDRDDDCLMCSILPYIDSKNENATILTRSLEDYGICLSFKATVDFKNTDYAEYPSHDIDVPNDPAYRECEINDVIISDLMLTDGDEEIMINDPDIIEKVKDETLSSNVIDKFKNDQEESFDPNDMDDYYDEYEDDY